MTRMFGFRMAWVPSRCYMEEWGDTAMAKALCYGNEHEDFHVGAQNANAHAGCRLISLVSASSAGLWKTVVGDLVNANVSECGHGRDGCWSWKKLAEHRMKPCSDLLWPYGIER